MTQEQKRNLARSGLLGGFTKIHQFFRDFHDAREQELIRDGFDPTTGRYPEEIHGPGVTTQDIISLVGFAALGAVTVYGVNQLFGGGPRQ